MIPPDPTNLTAAQAATIGGLSALGGLAAFLGRLRSGDLHGPMWLEFTTDIAYSMAAGVSTWFLVGALTGCPWIAGGCALIGAHQGARWLTVLQRTVILKMGCNPPE